MAAWGAWHLWYIGILVYVFVSCVWDEGGTKRQNQQDTERKLQEKRAAHFSPTRGYFQGKEGTMITSWYRVLTDVGLGTFGRVWNVLTSNGPEDWVKTDENMAIMAREDEWPSRLFVMWRDTTIQLLSMRIFWSAILLDSFSWKSHYCLVFESPGPSRYNLMMRYDYQLFQWVVWSHSYRYQGGRLLLCSMSFLFIVRWCFLLTTHALVFLLRYSPRILHFARPVSSTTPVMGRHREPPSPRESSLSTLVVVIIIVTRKSRLLSVLGIFTASLALVLRCHSLLVLDPLE